MTLVVGSGGSINRSKMWFSTVTVNSRRSSRSKNDCRRRSRDGGVITGVFLFRTMTATATLVK